MNLNHWISHWAETAPDKPAIVFGDQQYSYSDLASATASLAAVFKHDLTADDRILAVLPMFHAGRLKIQTLPALYAGATVILHPGYDPGAALASIASDLPSLTALVPAQSRFIKPMPMLI